VLHPCRFSFFLAAFSMPEAAWLPAPCAGAGVRTVPKAEAADAHLLPGVRFGPIDDPHEVGAELGHGAAARVFACRRLRTGEELAVKIINIQRLRLMGDLERHLAKLDREVQILRQLRHMRIVNLHMVHRTKDWYFLVMERVWGGELFQQIVQKKALSELEAKHVFRQLLEGVTYMHSKGVIHRDLKPENILVVRSYATPPPAADSILDVKIVDFGLSKIISEGASLAKTFVGTPQYWAPEVLSVQDGGGTYDQAADLWGLGVVLFVMLSGRYPFDGRKRPLEEQIRSAAFNINTSRWRGISDDAKDLVRGLLQVDPCKRLRLENCFCHPWIMSVAGHESTMAWSACRGATAPGSGIAGAPPAMQTSAGPPDRPVEDEPEGLHCALRSRDLTPVLEGRSGASSQASKVGADDGANVAASNVPAEAKPFAFSAASWSAAASPDDNMAWDEDDRASTDEESDEDSGEESGEEAAAPCAQHPPLVARRWERVNIMHWIAGTLLMLSLVCATFVPVTPKVEGVPADRQLVERPKVEPWWTRPRVPSAHPAESWVCPAPTANAIDNPPFIPKWHDVQVPFVQINDVGAGDGCKEQETVFRLSELLKLQVSIIGSLRMASMAFRHADRDLADATHTTFIQARELFQHATNVVEGYASVAQQVSQSILPDLALAVDQRAPSLALNLLVMVKAWVTDMRTDGEAIRRRYAELHQSVLTLAQRAQRTKKSADRRLMETAKALGGAERPDTNDEERFALEPIVSDKSGLNVCTHPSADAANGNNCGDAAAVLGPGEESFALNARTQQLFKQLTELIVGPQGHSVVSAAGGGEHFEDWKRDVLDLMFLAPGIVPSQLAVAQSGNVAAPMLTMVNAEMEEEEQEGEETHGRADGTETVNASSEVDGDQQGSAVKRYVKQAKGSKPSSAENAVRSSAILLRALRELRRVDAILQGCSSFWTNMDGTVLKLAQMKEHTEALVSFAADNPRLRERFDQRLREYTSFWASLERICRQYCRDHQATSERMHRLLREVEGAVDVADTTESARAGVMGNTL